MTYIAAWRTSQCNDPESVESSCPQTPKKLGGIYNLPLKSYPFNEWTPMSCASVALGALN